MTSRLLFLTLVATCLAPLAHAGDLKIAAVPVVEMKSIYGQVQARSVVLARARIPGTLVHLAVTEGDMVKAGDVIARIDDDKIEYQIKAMDAQLLGLKASLADVRGELDRAERLSQSGVTTAQRLDQLRAQVDVAENQIKATEAQRSVLVQQASEGAVLAPTAGKILDVPVTRNGVIMAGETVATIGGGGLFLRLSIPERHAAALKQGAEIAIDAAGRAGPGRLAKIYPRIEGGRVTADVEVEGLGTDFVGARLPVLLPVGMRDALLVPTDALITRAGIDFLRLREGADVMERAVIVGEPQIKDGKTMIEILTGLSAGDTVVTP